MTDGRVLVAGGNSAAGVVNTVDIMGTGGTFTAGPPMLTARASAACALLNDGRVFVAGGTDGTAALASAEIYTPSTNLWTSAGQMNVARYGHTATVTKMGAVLLVGGQTGNGVTAQVEAYRPANGLFTVLGSLSSPRTGYTVTVLDNHRTLIAGGSDGTNTLGSIDMFDSRTNLITAVGNMMIGRRNFGSATLLDGTVLFTGGYGPDGSVLATTEIYDPSTQTSTAGPQLTSPRANHQSIALTGNGSVLLAGGTDGQNTLSATDVYEPWTGKFARKAQMNSARTGLATSLMRRGTLMAAGGQNGSGYLSGSETYAFAFTGTDKPDYQPGNVATFSGSGFKPGETVALTVTSFPVDQHGVEFSGTAVADATGQISLTGFNIDRSHLGMKFLLHAAGSQSQAETTFTDSTPDNTTVNVTTVTPASPQIWGQAIEFIGVVDNVGGGSGNGTPQGSAAIYDNNISINGNYSLPLLSVAVPAPISPETIGPPLYPAGGFDFQVPPNDPLGILSPGNHIFQIEYTSGDASKWNASYSVQVPFTVTYVSTQTAFTGDTVDVTIAYGAQATLKAVVSNLSDSNGTYSEPPQGALLFETGISADTCTGVPTYGPSVPLGLSKSQTLYTCLTSVNLSAGIHNYYADFGGMTGVFHTSTTLPDTRSVTVNQVSTTTTIVPSLVSPQVYPQAITLTATVIPNAGAGPVTGQVNFYDGSTDICGVAYPLGGAPLSIPGEAQSCSFVLTGGDHSLTATYSPGPGNTNFAASNSGALAYHINAAPTTSTLSLVPAATQSFGSSETFDATVACTVAGCVAPVGTVNFLDLSNSAQPINAAPIPLTASGTTGVASYATSALSGGPHQIAIAYTSTNPSFASNTQTSTLGVSTGPSLTSLLYTVTGISPTFTVGIQPSSPTAYQPLTLTFTANPLGGHTPLGSLQLVVDGSTNGGFVILNNGVVTFNLAAGLAQGSHTVAVNYQHLSGEVDFIDTTPATVLPTGTFTVNPTATTTAVTASQTSPMLYGTPVTFTATVSSAVSGTPTGTIKFYDNGNPISGNIALSGNVATLSYPPTTALVPAAGGLLHPITAIYSGDTNFATSTSPALNFTVNQATTATTVSATVTTINLGQSTQYTASVQGTPPGAGNPTGSVTINDNGVAIGACTNLTPLSNANPATVSCTVTYNGLGGLGGGSHSIVASYASNTVDFASGTSTPITVTVNQASTSIGPLTMPGIVSATAVYNNGGTAPTISIPFVFGNTPPPSPANQFQVYDTGTLIGNLAVPGVSPAVFTLPASVYQFVGSHTFVVKYPTGDPNYAAGASAALAFSVTKYTPTVSATGFTGNTYGNQVTVGGSVSTSGAGLGAAAATGTLTFTYGATTLGTCTLAGSPASCTLTTTNTALVVGPDSINIAYGGDGNYNTASTASNLSITQNTVTTVMTTSPVNIANLNTPVIIKATVAALGGSGIPTGTMTFYDAFNGGGATNIGTGALSGTGVAILNTSNLQAGPHILTASYPGDANFAALAQNAAGVTSASLTVSTGNTTVTITPSANTVPLGPGSTVTYSFAVSGGNTPPAGTATLIDSLGSIGINAANGTCVTTGVTLAPPGTGSTTTGSCTMIYNAQDAAHGAGVHTLYFQYVSSNTSNWANANSPVTQVTVGTTTPTIGLPVSSAGNSLVYLQNTALSVTLTGTSGGPAPTGNVNFYDTGTLLNATPVALVGNTATLTAAPYAVGTHTFKAVYLGDSNYGTVTSAPLSVTVAKNATATAFNPSPSNQVYGVGETLTAQVTIPTNNAGTPTGTITFWAGATNLGTGTLSCAGTCTASISLTTQLTAATGYNLTAVYSGDGNYLTSTSGITVINVLQNTVKITMSTSPITTANINTSVVISAAVAPAAGGGTPTGQVQFYDAFNGGGPASIGTAPLVNGVAQFSTASLAAGPHIFTASYLGDTNYAQLLQPQSSSIIVPANLSVTTGNTTITLVPSATSILLGPSSTVTYTATVTGGNTVPQGVVTLVDNNGPIGNTAWGTCANAIVTTPAVSGNSISGSCTMIYNGQDAEHSSGTHLLYVSFVSANTANWSSGNSATKQVTVTTGTASITLPVSSAGNSLVYNQQTSISTVVTGSTGGPAPTGSVNFYDGATLLNASPLPLGTALPLAAYSLGTHTITAQYLGDNNYASVTSLPLTITVTKNGTVTTSLFTGNQTYGIGVTLTAQVAPVPLPGNAATGNPTGSVTFWAGATNLGTGTLSCAVLPCSATTTLINQLTPSGSAYALTATYSGDANFATSTSSNSSSATVLKNAVTTAVATSPLTTANLNSVVILSTTVTTTNSGIGTPTGNVTFYDNGTSLGTTALVNGVATLSTSNLTAGLHTITADYAGDANFLALLHGAPGATSTSITVIAGNTTVTLTPSATSISIGTNSTITYAFTVTGGNTPPAGTVALIDSLGSLGVNSALGTCIATPQNLAPPASGNTTTGSCTVIYNGTPNTSHGSGVHNVYFSFVTADGTKWTSANSAATQITVGVTPATIALPVSSAGNSLVYNQQTAISVVVTGTSGGPAPTGSVNFFDGTTLLNASPIALGSPLPLAAYAVGTHTITAQYLGDNNYGAVTSSPLSVVVNRNTTSTVSLFTGNQTYGIGVTLTATVTPTPLPGGGATGNPTGTVTFWAGATNLGTGTLSCASLPCSATTTLINQLTPSGTPYALTAVYNDDTNFSGSTSSNASAATVLKNAVTTAVATSPLTTANLNSVVLLSTTVTTTNSGIGTPTGNVTFYDNGTSLGTSALVNGVATLSTSNLTAGLHTITADYAGDANFLALLHGAPGATSANITVIAGNTNVTLTPSATSITIGANSTITYAFAVTGGNTPPAGTVALIDSLGSLGNNSALGTCVATPQTLVPPASGNTTTGSCTVIYNGQPNTSHGSGVHNVYFSFVTADGTKWTSANSAAAQITVGVTPATIALPVSSAGNSLVYNQQTAISVVVTGTSGGPAPTGSVNYFDGATLLNASPIALGSPLPLAAYAVGTHTITAQYLGDNNYGPVTSLPLSIVVSKNGTATASLFTGNQTYGIGVTITATVTPTPLPGNAATGNPTGTVTFWAGATNLGTGTLSCVVLPCSATTTLINQLTPAGTAYALTAVYNDDTNFSGSTSSNSSSATILKNAVTSVVATSPLSTANLNSVVILSTAVYTTNSGIGTPTGNVTFYDNGTSLGTSALVNGVATLSTSNLTAGLHTITADYAGDANFLALLHGAPGATSASITVIAGNTNVTLTPSATSIAIGTNSTITYAFTVTGGNTPPAGTVALIDSLGSLGNNSSLGTCVATPQALAPPGSGNTTTGSCTVIYNGAPNTSHGSGVHNVYFSFVTADGTKWTSANSAAAQITVSVTPATIALPVSSAGNTLVYDQQTAISVVVTGTSGGPAPTGSVNYFDGGTLLNASPIALGSPLSLAAYAVGTHTITAQYLGDNNYGPVTSAPLSIQVNKNGTVTTVTGPANQTYGLGQTLTATVTIPVLPNGTPTGTVTFWSGATNLGTGTLSSGGGGFQATITLINQLTPSGSAYPLSATYNGDGNFLSSTSTNSSSVLVQKNGLTQSLTPSPLTTASLGQTVLLTAVFGPAAGGTGIPTGIVTFYDLAPGSSTPVSLGTATLNAAGVATLSTSSLIPSSHTLSASYGGDANFAAVAQAAGPTAALTIIQGNTVVTLTPSSNPASLNQTITYNFTVQGGPTSPTGNVTLSDGIAGGGVIPSCTAIALTAPGTGNTSSGNCTVAYNSSDAIHGIGSHPISASYTPTAGSTNWSAGVSSVVTEVVGKVQPSMSAITVTPSVVSTCSPNYCFPYGTTFSFSVTMTPASPSPAYTAPVVFTNNGVPIGQASINAAGVATLQGILLGGGTNNIVATFPGDANYLSDPVSVVIIISRLPLQPNTTETLSQSTITVTYGSSLPALAAPAVTVTFAAPILCPLCAIPTGTVDVYAGPTNLLLGTYNILANGVTNITVPVLPAALSAGAGQVLTAIYSGDANYAPPVPQLSATLNVNKANPAITITSSPDPSNFNQNVIFVSNVTYPVGQATGSVAFIDTTNSVTLTPNALLVGGTASYQTANLSPGLHAVSATYSGDTNFNSVSVAALSAVQQNVQAGNVTLTVTPSTYNTSLNTSVVFTIVASSAAGAPQGTVSLYDAITGNPPSGITNCVLLPLLTIAPPVNPPSSNAFCTVNYNSSNAGSIFGAGIHIITATYATNAITWTNAGSPAVTVTVGKAPVTISQPTVNPTPTTYGVPLTYSVTLTPNTANPNYAANSVQFYDNGVPLGSPVSVAVGTGVATSAPTVPLGGSHTINAQFVGDNNYTQSAVSANLVFSIAKAVPTVTVLTPPASAPYVGQISTGVVTVGVPASNNGITPTGSVSLIAGTTTLATVALPTTGFANVQLPASLTVGNYNLYVQYGGDGNWAATASAITVLAIGSTPAPVTVTSLNIPPSSATNPIYGQSLLFTATFNGPGNPVTGTVLFQDNNTTTICGASVVVNNVATCTVSVQNNNLLPVGLNNINIATLSGDLNHTLGATTPTGNFSVVVDPTVTTLTSTPNPSLPGQSFALTAQVNVPAPGVGSAGSLNGTVTFVLNVSPAVNLCTAVPLSSTSTGATAGCTVPANTAPFNTYGPYNITATYTPAANDKNAPSISNTITQQVSKPSPIFLSLTSSVNPSAYGQTVTFTTTFSLPAGSSTGPTGSIQFYDGGTSLGGLQSIAPAGSSYTSSITVPNVSSANYSASGPCGYPDVLCGGQHIITAVYVPGNNDNYGSANSATQANPISLNQVVSQSTVTITPQPETYTTQGIPNAPVYAEWVTYTVVIAPSAGNVGVPTGLVIFKDAGTQFGPAVSLVQDPVSKVITASITIATASVPSFSTAPGGHPAVTASYLGDANFAPITSIAFTNLIISAAPTKTVLGAIPSTPLQYGSQLTLSATVCATQVNPTATNGCIGTPFPGFKGTMTFYDGGANLNPGGTPVLVDPNTGIASITITLTSGPLQGAAVGSHNIIATYNGDADFAASSSTPPNPPNLSVVKGSTTSNVASITANPSVIGQPVIFQVQVIDAGSFAAAPTGTVQFYDGGNLLGTSILGTVGGIATAQFTVPSGNLSPFTLGQHVISTVYSGDSNYASSATALSPPCTPGVSSPCALVQTVSQAVTTTTISSSQNGSTTGQQVTLTAQIQVVQPGQAILSGPSAGPTGTVVFTNNVGALNNVLGTGIVTRTVVNGSSIYLATLTLANIPTGNVAITAAYSGDQNYTASTSQALNQSVSKVASNVTLVSNLNPSILGQSVTFTITLSPVPPGTGIPTGAVTLYDGSNLLANIQLVGGQATYTTAALSPGLHGINVSYTGDVNFQGVVSPQTAQLVSKIQSTLNLTSSVPAGAVASQVITFTAQIQPTPPPGVPYATGQIGFFMDGALQIGAASLASGVAALSTTLPAGNHQIQAFYIGDGNWTAAQSIYLQQLVGTANTTTQVVSSANPSVFGQAVTFTITVSVPYPGTVPASGTVQLYDSGNAIGTPVPANNGTFSVTVTSLAPGNHSIIAQFQANGSFSQSSSAALSQIVNKAPTVTTLGAFPNSSTSNQNVTLTAVIAVPSPGAGTPTGTVQFVNTSTSTVLGSSPLTLIGGIWTATLNTTSLNQGSQQQLITATYSGDGNFAASTSAPEGLSVFNAQIAVVNAAGYTSSNFAPGSFAAIFGQNLSYTALTAATTPLPTSLGGSTVLVTDSAGVTRLALLYYVSLSQINFVIPANTQYGLASVTVTNASGETASTQILITITAPGLYSENASGQGVAAGYLVTVHADGTQSAQTPLFQYNPNTNKYVGIPIVWNLPTDQQFLVLYGTGFDAATRANTTATMNGISVPVLYVGPQPQFTAEDQLNMGPIPQSLKGAGAVNVVISVNGQVSNTVQVSIQ